MDTHSLLGINRALDMFADVTQDEFLDVAENWIVEQMAGARSKHSVGEHQARTYRFSEPRNGGGEL